MSEAPLLAARAVAKGYPSGGRRLEVLRGVDFEGRAGEMVAVVGASGVGKSTLLHLLGGLDRPDSGQVLHRGRLLTALDPEGLAAFRNRTVGFVFQFHYLLPEFDALENVMMPRLIRGERRREVEAKAAALLEEMGIAERARHRPGELSGGEQQRVAIARALAAEPEVVLADEPTGDLDRDTGEQVFAALASRVRARGILTVLVTHNEALARRAGRVLRLVAGRLEPETPASGPDAKVPAAPCR